MKNRDQEVAPTVICEHVVGATSGCENSGCENPGCELVQFAIAPCDRFQDIKAGKKCMYDFGIKVFSG